MSLPVKSDVSLAAHTTLAVGGLARHWLDAHDEAQVALGLEWANARGLRVEVLGGGSNALVADRGLDALVLRVRAADLRVERAGNDWLVEVGAGYVWDELVAWSVERDLAGLECLSGIPGDVGAAPMQNVGAYGQEVSQSVDAVVVVERSSGRRVELDKGACHFGYRDSVFKRQADGAYVVLAVRFRLAEGGAPTVAYAELEQALVAAGRPVTLTEVRGTVIRLRRAKSMVIEPNDENRRSAGSFFVNPTLGEEHAARVEALAADIAPAERMPRWQVVGGRIKLSAAWLIERAGFPKGNSDGPVGISTRHSLAIVNKGGATAAQIVAYAARVRARVRERFDVALTPEPRLLGFEPDEITGLVD